jgi:NitT/TauT family transport system substrate-binding protein
MLSRRQFSIGLGVGAATCVLPRQSFAQGKTTMRWANASGFASPQLANGTIGMHPDLGFYAEENINLEVLNMQGSATTIQNVITNVVDFASLSPISYLPLKADNPNVDVVVPFVWLRPMHTQLYVLPDSPIKTVADLAGKTIGFINQADTSYLMARQMFKELGIDADQNVSWVSTGAGIPAAQALKNGKVDALAGADTNIAILEIAGYSFRGLPNIGLVSELFGLAWGVRRSSLEKNRKAYVGLFRGMAKSTIFANANPERATRLHYELYPEAVPTGIPLDQAVDEAQRILSARKNKWMPATGSGADSRIGGQTEDDWRKWLAFTGLSGRIKDVSSLYNTELLDEVNDFDHEAIRKMALAR